MSVRRTARGGARRADDAFLDRTASDRHACHSAMSTPAKPDGSAPIEPGRVEPGRKLYTATSGALLAATPIPLALWAWAHGSLDASTPLWAQLLVVSASLGLLVAGLVIPLRPRFGRITASLAALSTPLVATAEFARSPTLALLVCTATVVTLVLLWQLGAPMFVAGLRRNEANAGRVRGSALVAAGFWLTVSLGGGRHESAVVACSLAASALAAAIGAWWLHTRRRRPDPRARIVLVGLLAALGLAFTTAGDLWALASCGAIYALVAATFGPRNEPSDAHDGRWWSSLFEHPARMLVSTFATLAALGAVVLALPHSSTDELGLGGLDAAFTAVSAVCVTGLATRDVSTELSALGQVALLVLMQLGALGIMTFSTAALRVLGGRMSLRQESAVARLIGASDQSRVITSAQEVLRVTFLVEGIGAVLLTALFAMHGDDLGQAAWRGVFTAVSAFCNAGFSLQSDSLMPYRTTPLILHTVAALIVLGGLSPAVILAFARRENRSRPLAAQARICLVAAAVLLVFGATFFLVIEWNHSLAGLSVADKVHNAWFQSATLRTAGFNSVDIGAVQAASYLLMLVLMFIGASPGGTAGGVKTTTITALIRSAAATIRGVPHATVFGRRIAETTLHKAAVIVTVAVAANLLGVFALLLTQELPFTAAVFEIVSAIGTVGLSQGATSRLDEVGKVIVMVCMFVGRIGGLSIMMFMSQRRTRHNIVLPTEELDVG